MERIQSLIYNRNYLRACGCTKTLLCVLVFLSAEATGQVSESSARPDGMDWNGAALTGLRNKRGIDVRPLDRLAYRDAISLCPDGKVLVAGSTAVKYRYTYDEFSGMSHVGEPKKIEDTATVQQIVLQRFNRNGTADTNFNRTGTAVFGIDSLNDQAVVACVGADGRMLVAARSSCSYPYRQYLTVFCISSKGRLDPAFGTGGLTVLNFEDSNANLVDATLLPDGRFLLASIKRSDDGIAIWMYCLNSKGKLDRNFGRKGILIDSLHGYHTNFDGLGVRIDGGFSVFCRSAKWPAQYLLTPTYTNHGFREAKDNASSIELGEAAYLKTVKQLPDGSLLLLLSIPSPRGYHTELRKYLPGNRPDSSFCRHCNVPGRIDFGEDQFADGLNDIYQLPDSSLLLLGTPGLSGLGNAEINTRLFLGRIYKDGTRDSTFGRDGWQRITDDYRVFGINYVASYEKSLFVLAYMSRDLRHYIPGLLLTELGKRD